MHICMRAQRKRMKMKSPFAFVGVAMPLLLLRQACWICLIFDTGSRRALAVFCFFWTPKVLFWRTKNAIMTQKCHFLFYSSKSLFSGVILAMLQNFTTQPYNCANNCDGSRNKTMTSLSNNVLKFLLWKPKPSLNLHVIKLTQYLVNYINPCLHLFAGHAQQTQ